ncbi:MAG: hypothetical protein Q9174_003067, partial [Haloplaca sp. 1 TL-2023]
MGTETNGRAVEPSNGKSRPNGHIPYQQKSPKSIPSTGLFRRLFNIVTRSENDATYRFAVPQLTVAKRILFWYTLFTTQFRCPSSITDITNDHSRVCHPYLTARSHINPYAQPYYDQYVAPYVDAARPYTDKYEQKIYTPVYTFSKQSYDQYGAPRVQQASDFGQHHWEQTLRPKIQEAQTQAKTQYDTYLGPHVDKAWVVGESYYSISRQNVLHVYNSQVLPAYNVAQPHLQKAYSTVEGFALDTGIPYARSAWLSTVVLFDRTIWPQLRIVYGENVEPQLVRIGERLGRYRDGKRLKAAVKEAEVSSESTTISSTVSSLSSSVAAAVSSVDTGESTAASTSEASSCTTAVPKQDDEEVRQKIADDLKNWQENFAKAADKGTEDLEQRVKEITDRQIESQIKGTGEALFVTLEETAKSENAHIKSVILKLVKALPKEPTTEDVEKAEESLSKTTRQAGLKIKDKAQAIRDWKVKLDHETQSLVTAASESTLEVIDNIRDLGLQEVGMRWAWMEGVTYKDWSKYHSVRKTFDEWRKEIETISSDHEGLQMVSDAATDLESRGMITAEDAAKELQRLKAVGKWKLQSADDSDDFSTKSVPPKVAKQGQKVLKEASSVSDQIMGTTQDASESLSSQISGQAANAFSKIDSESIVAAAKDKAEQVSGQASEAVAGSQTPVHESIAAGASSSVASASSMVSEELPSSSTPASESASSVASAASKKVYGGAMAQAVGEQKPILDDLVDEDSTYSEKMQSMVDQAGENYADVTRAVSEAIFRATKTQGTAESVTSVANQQYSSALAAASKALYGTQQGAVESMTSVAADRYSEAVAAASSALFGAPIPATESAAAQASSIYAEASSRAYDQYTNAKSAASAQISGKPKPAHQSILSSIESAYADSVQAASQNMVSAMNAASATVYGTGKSPQQSALSAANAKYSEAMAAASAQLESAKSVVGQTSTPGYESFLSEANQKYSSLVGAADSQRASATKAASEAIYGPSQGVLESISAVASSRLADSLAAASAQYSNVKVQAGATPTPAHQQYLQEGQRKYYEAVGLAHERYSEFFNAASSAVYVTPTPAYEGMYSAASESLFGTPAPAYQNALDGAQVQYSAAVAKASENLNAIIGSANSAVGKSSKSPAQSILDSASSSYSAALLAASASLSSVSSAASAAAYGSQTGVAESIASVVSDKANSITAAASSQVAGETPWSESVASQASANWEALVSKASEQVYGAPTPWSESMAAQAGEYAAQATDGAFAQYEAVQALFKEMVSGKEPDFTESVMNRLSAAYYTGAHASAAASASSYVSDTYASASSAVSGMYTPPASLEAIFQAASDQVNAAVDAASE